MATAGKHAAAARGTISSYHLYLTLLGPSKVLVRLVRVGRDLGGDTTGNPYELSVDLYLSAEPINTQSSI